MNFPIHSKVAGVSSGPYADGRQAMLKYIAEHPDRHWHLKLEPEPDNPYDADAIKVMVYSPNGKLCQLGYVTNSLTICTRCSKSYERHPGTCACGEEDYLCRYGTATKLSKLIREGVKLEAAISEITGQTDGRSYGCNIVVDQVQG